MQPNTRGNPLVGWIQRTTTRLVSKSLRTGIFVSVRTTNWSTGRWRKVGVQSTFHFLSTTRCLVYSVGSNGDASFEAAILQDVSPECEIHVFDFGNYEASVLQQTNHSPHVHYHQWGISDVTGGVFKTLQDTVQELGHVGRTIDIFKIDCEGCELDTFSSWFHADVTLKQILVEIHPRMSQWQPSVKLPETVNFFHTLHKQGYVITHKEPNIQYQGNGFCVEYNFLLLSPEFWTSSNSNEHHNN